ncbi:tRNA pseudouridine(55) synthase TruB [Clostridium swellfunianum]|uniref:tRNA pseudouridine(55) synthase TruB n=1 Tax=Clostridium swellfunianum TaxID=1367462 RepID=UPI00202EB3A9|nr:tRNA pseudouridine(55) synthase TruB [Clostridium swellfunianum]MCM0648580.1 tRNA pseudouridine(55) synthase TruB [Clostridium swellfunianum]
MDGILNIYKPSGISSFDAVKKVMKICGTKKVGHTGTLDPLASGVLPICIGKATKIVDYIMSETKVYKAQLRLGVITDTYDREGEITHETDVKLSEEDIIDTITSFVGESEQEPPMYSALKVNGKRLYELARQGINVEREKRKITIYSIEILNISLPLVDFIVTCSKGTYIRSLCYDIGEKLGVGGAMWDLERIQTGSFKIEDSVKLDDLDKDNVSEFIIPIEEGLSKYDKVIFSSKHEKLLLNGVKINNEYLIRNIEFNKLYRVYLDGKTFVGLGIRDDVGFKITKLLI